MKLHSRQSRVDLQIITPSPKWRSEVLRHDILFRKKSCIVMSPLFGTQLAIILGNLENTQLLFHR